MKISIGCTQRFDVTVTLELVELLTKLGNLHYDYVCKAAVNHGGFIYGWSNHIAFSKDGEVSGCRIDNGELQTCLKICERPPPLTEAESDIRRKFTVLALDALHQASKDPRFSEIVPVGQVSAAAAQAAEIEKLRAENTRLYAQAVTLLYFVPGETKVDDILEVRAKYDEWLAWLTTSKSLVRCKLDNDGDGDCPIHPDGCPTSVKPA